MTTSNDPTGQIRSCVETAIRLGWRMAQVYHRPPRPDLFREDLNGDPPDHLPGERKLGDYERGKTLVAEIQNGIAILEKALDFELLSQGDLGDISNQRSVNENRKSLLEVHRELHGKLAEHDPRFARAFDLGRMLADTLLLSDPTKSDTLLYEFNHYRLGNAYLWLNDLHSLLPEHASFAVSGSLKAWEDLIRRNNGVIPTDTSSQGRFHQALHDQGEAWRQLLCDEKPGKDFLVAKNYNAAGNRVTKHFLSLIYGFISGWRYAIALSMVVLGAIGYLIVRFTPHHQPLFPAIVLTVATTLGITWKTVASTLGQVAKAAGEPLWDAEVNEAIVLVTTHTPNFKIRIPDSSKTLYEFPGETSV